MSVSVQSYRFLEHAFGQVSHTRMIIDTIKWDCVNFAHSSSYSFDDIFSVEEMKYDMLVNPALSSAIEDAMSKSDLLTPGQMQNLQCMSTLSRYFSAIPVDLYKAFVKAKAKGFFAWVMATKQYSEFDSVPSAFAGLLQRLREVATCIAEAEGINRYDALMGMVEREVKSSDIEFILSKLGPLIRRSTNGSLSGSPSGTSKSLVVGKQRKILEDCAEKIGFRKNELLMVDGSYELRDWVRPGDYRVFIDYKEDSLYSAVVSLLRITAEAVYKAALTPDWTKQPVCWMNLSVLQAVTALISEHIASSSEFDSFIKLHAKGPAFGLSRIPKGSLMRLFSTRGSESEEGLGPTAEISRLARSSIRYSLERELLDGKIESDSIVDAWKDGLKYYFGTDVSMSELDCYGESWAGGDFCTAPLKVFSSVVGSQLFSCLREQSPSALAEVKEGEFSSIFRWIRDNVCLRSVSMGCSSIIQELSGSPLDADSYAAMLGLIQK